MEIIEARGNNRNTENISECDENQRNTLEFAALCDQEHRDCTAGCKDSLCNEQDGFLLENLVERYEQIIDIRSVDMEMRDEHIALGCCHRVDTV